MKPPTDVTPRPSPTTDAELITALSQQQYRHIKQQKQKAQRTGRETTKAEEEQLKISHYPDINRRGPMPEERHLHQKGDAVHSYVPAD